MALEEQEEEEEPVSGALQYAVCGMHVIYLSKYGPHVPTVWQGSSTVGQLYCNFNLRQDVRVHGLLQSEYQLVNVLRPLIHIIQLCYNRSVQQDSLWNAELSTSTDHFVNDTTG